MKNPIIRRCAALAAIGLSSVFLFPSCATIPGQGIVKSKQSEFDKSKVVSVSPAMVKRLPGSSFGVYPNLGALWTSSSPDTVDLTLSYDGGSQFSAYKYMSIRGLEINLDGKISSYSTRGFTNYESGSYNTVSHKVPTYSTNSVRISLSKLRRMVASENCKLRVRTSKGDAEFDFAAEKWRSMSMAKVHIKKFLTQVESVK